MFANWLSLLDKNCDALWLCAVLLALAFRRNRYVLVLAALGGVLWASDANPGLLAASGALMLLVVVLPEPSLWSLRAFTLVSAAAVVPFMAQLAPELGLVLDQVSSATLAFTAPLGLGALLLAGATATALLRWLYRGWPLDLYLAIALIPAIVAYSSNAPHSLRAWLGATSAALAIAVLYGAYRMAFIDALTGLPNRRALDERLARSQGRIAVAMADVDHFKRFNDRHGHEAGDRVLRTVARELRRCRGGSAYRYGGEEFAIVFEGRQVERAGEALESVRAGVEAVRVRLRAGAGGRRTQAVRRGQAEGEVGVTISIGVAERDPERRTCSAVIDAADKALYRSKQRGRNRLTLAGAART
jgi:diguanylate cyclase (GGDEF)-like protein